MAIPKESLGGPVFWRLSRQLLKRQRVSSDHVAQSINEQIRTATAVKPEGHFLKVGRKMFCGNFMPRTNDSALQERERGFDTVRGNVAVNVNALLVLDGSVLIAGLSSAIQREGIDDKFISHDYVHIFAYVLFDVFRQRASFHIFGLEEAQFASALFYADHGNLGLLPFINTETPRLAAEIGFIHFHCSVKHVLFSGGHRSANTMAEIPRRFVGAFVFSPDGAPKLIGAHALLRFAYQQHGEKPYRQREVRVMENRSARHRELILANGALETCIVFHSGDAPIFAAGAGNAFGPAKPLHKFTATVIRRKHLVQVKECHG